MPLDSAVEHFAKLATDVFSDKKYLSTSGSGAFKSTKMQRALKSIVRAATPDENENERMMDNRVDTERCKTVVFAMSKHNMNAGMPRAFRSYQAPINQMSDCTIWEALCATTAHPDLFESIDIGDGVVKESFVDGGLGCGNPLPHILAEVKLVYPNRHVGCVISIGAGHTRTIHIPKSSPLQRFLPSNAIEAMKAIAMDSEKEAQRMAIRFNRAKDVYFRLNVDQGIQSVELGDWERLNEVVAHTGGYMRQIEVSKTIDKSVAAIKSKKKTVEVADIDGQIPAAIGQVNVASVKFCPQPTSLFVGREGPVQRVAEYLLNDTQQRKTFVIHGLGGAGKTQTALRIVEKTREHWSDIVFADATSVMTIEATLKDFAIRKALGDTHDDALRWLASTTARWLLLIDNADDPSVDVLKYLPEGSGGSVLITTRNQDLLELALGPGSDYNMSSMELEEAMQLLLKASRREDEKLGKNEMRAVQRLLEHFGYLPLAITQAGGYIRRNQCSFAKYRELFLNHPKKMLQQHNKVRMQLDKYERTVFDTWMLSYELLSDKAKSLLGMAAYMRRDQISMEIFRRAALNANGLKPAIPLSKMEQKMYRRVRNLLNPFVNPCGDWDCDAFLNVIGEILAYSLMQYDRVTEAYSLHPLVQTWARMVAAEQGNIQTAYLVAASLEWSSGSMDHAFLRSLHLHVQCVLERSPELCTTVAACLGGVLHWNGQWEKASQLQSKVLLITLEALGMEHPDTLGAMNDLANTYCRQGLRKEELKLRAQVYDSSKRVLGMEHPNTLTAMNNLASTYSGQRRWKEAEELGIQVLDAYKRTFGVEEPVPLATINNLAHIYFAQGRRKEAEELMLLAVETRKRVLSVEHPDTLAAMSNLANIYSGQGQWKEAEELQIQVLDARQQVFGIEHPDTLNTMGNLANNYHHQGRQKEAEELQVLVLDAETRVLGMQHPNTLEAMSRLAATYYVQGRQEEAEELWVQALDAMKPVLGIDHPDTLTTISKLAKSYCSNRRWKDAESLGVQTLDALKQVLGVEHLDTLEAMANLSITYNGQGRLRDAEALWVQVLDARKRALGAEHLDTLMVLGNLAATYNAQGRWEEAAELWVKGVETMKRVLGAEHPTTLITMMNFANARTVQGRREEAEDLTF